MKVEIFADADSVAREAATMIAVEARAAVAERGRFIMAVSGGPHPMGHARRSDQRGSPLG